MRIATAYFAGVLLTVAFPATPAMAQDEQYAPIVLQLSGSARAGALGGAFVAVRDIESILANPAFAGFATGTAISAERFRESRAGSITASMTLGQFGVAVSTQYLDFTTSPVEFLCDFSCPPLPMAVPSHVLSVRQAAAASSLAASIGASTTYKGFRWGTAVKYVEQRLGARRESGPAVDVGVAKEGSLFIIGLAVQNLGPAVGDEPAAVELPARATLGVATLSRPIGAFDVSLSTAVSVLRDGFVAPAGGMEWGYSPLEGYTFVARVGARRPELKELRPLTLGASFSFDRLSLDYAFDDVRGGAGHRLGLRVR